MVVSILWHIKHTMVMSILSPMDKKEANVLKHLPQRRLTLLYQVTGTVQLSVARLSIGFFLNKQVWFAWFQVYYRQYLLRRNCHSVATTGNEFLYVGYHQDDILSEVLSNPA